MTAISRRISAEGLKDYIRQVELPKRATGRFSNLAETVLRCGGFVGSEIEHHSKLDRAMLHARSLINRQEEVEHSVASGTTIIADRLTTSKGRFTRGWYAPEGGLWGAMIYVSTLLPISRMLLPLAVGISCCEALRESGAEKAVIRWINDVLIDEQKVAGCLLEGFCGKVSKEEYNLIGFGINVNNRQFPNELKNQATSLSSQVGNLVDLQSFSYCFLAKLSWNLGLLCFEEERYLLEENWSGRQGRHPLLERWCELSDSLGRRVVFGFDVVLKPQYEATVTGISDDGGLQLVLDDGSEVVEYSGEIRYLQAS